MALLDMQKFEQASQQVRGPGGAAPPGTVGQTPLGEAMKGITPDMLAKLPPEIRDMISRVGADAGRPEGSPMADALRGGRRGGGGGGGNPYRVDMSGLSRGLESGLAYREARQNNFDQRKDRMRQRMGSGAIGNVMAGQPAMGESQRALMEEMQGMGDKPRSMWEELGRGAMDAGRRVGGMFGRGPGG